MTTLQKTLVTVAIVLAGAEIYTIRHAGRLRDQIESLQRQNAEQIQQLTRERDEARQRLAGASGQPLPNLPAPRVQVVTAPPDEPAATGLIARILEGEQVPRLTAEQTARYLEENHRDAGSLLAAYRTSGESSHLKEAMERFPDDPQVAFEALFAAGTPLAERRRWLDAFKQAAPENALANYLSALDHFKADRTDQAVEELIMASGKEGFYDFTRDRIQANEEAYRSAGYTEADTRAAAMWGLLMPQLSELRKLGASVVELAATYRQTGDNVSAQAALEMAVRLGERCDGPTGKESPLVSRMYGFNVEQAALKAMDPDHTFGAGTVKERLDQVAGQQQAIGDLAKQARPFLAEMTPQDWINYNDRSLMFGEEQAMRWLLNKYSQDGSK